jgi:hypothetical protein
MWGCREGRSGPARTAARCGAARVVVHALALTATACAEGYPAVESSALTESFTPGRVDAGTGGAPQVPVAGSGAAGMAPTGAAGSAAPDGAPCLRGEVETCACEEVEAQGRRTCVFDSASPLDGFFSECHSCQPPPPDPVEQCTDGEKNGFETDTDCGGPACDPCATGDACATATDCAESMCTDGTCTMPAPPAAGTSGGAGTSGAAGSGDDGGGDVDDGSGGSSSQTPVSSCRGQDRGTPCDRDCLLPGNTAQCNLLGICSCL